MQNTQITQIVNQPSSAYRSASIVTLAVGVVGFLLGLWNAELVLSEKGFYLAVFLLSLFSAVALQKTVRDIAEGIDVTKMFTTICWGAFFSSIALLAIGLFNAQMLLSEKGFYAMSFIVSLFAVITVQKNTRDIAADKTDELTVNQTEQEQLKTVEKSSS
ncbi:inner membrane protein YiaA [Gammaproteobacteria bacterium AS21]